MTATEEKTSSFAFYIGGIDPGKIDSQLGIIRDVRIMTQGVALGHDLNIDATTLQQVISASREYKNGIKVKLDHEGGAGEIVGWVDNFRQYFDETTEAVIGDLHLIKTHPRMEYILELAKHIPDTFGLSLFFIGKPESIEGQRFARCAKIFSCDIVTEPAANADGLFKVGERLIMNAGPIMRNPPPPEKTPAVDKSKDVVIETKKVKTMDPEEFAKCMEAYEANKAAKAGGEKVIPTKEVHQVNEDGSEKHVVTKGPTAMPEGDDDPEEMKKKMAAEIKAEIFADLRKQYALSGIKVPTGTTAADATALAAKTTPEKVDDTPKTFEDMCVHLRTKGNPEGVKLSATEAIKYAARYYPALHANYLERCMQESPRVMQMMQAQREGDKNYRFEAIVEHWKVQNTPNPALELIRS